MKKRSVIVACILCLCLGAVFGSDWPQFGGPNRNNMSPEKGLLKSWPADGPKVLWTVPLGAGFGGPAVEKGKVYILDRVKNEQDALRCLNLDTGKELWNSAYDAPGKLSHNGSRNVPTVGEKYVYSVGLFGDFTCIGKENHEIVWKKHLLNDFGGERPRWGVSQSPLLYKKTVIVAPISPKVGVAAFEQKTGEKVWESKPLEGEMGYLSPMLATIGGVEQVLMATTKQTAGLDAKTGEILWTYNGWQCKIPIVSPTAIGDGRVFVTGEYDSGSAMIRVEKKDGKFEVRELFKTKVCEAQIHQPLLYDGYLYVNSNGNERREGLICMDLEGNLKWRTQMNPNFDRGNIILAEGMIYIIDGENGTLHLAEANPEAYKEVSRTPMLGGEEIWAPMAISDGKLLVRDQSEMKCLDIKAR